MKRIIVTLAAVLAVMFAGVVPAFAQGNPETDQTGSIVIPTSATMTSTLPGTFTLAPGSGDSATTPQGGGTLIVNDNDSAGWFIALNGPASFTGTSASIPTSDVDYGHYFNDAATVLPTPANAATFYANSGASMGQGTSILVDGFWENTTPSVAPGTYSGTVNWVLWSN